MRAALRLGFVGLSLLAWGCGGALPRPPYLPQPSSALSIVPLAPPPPRVEQVPDSPAKGAVWIDGEWVYRRGRWAWLLGRWVAVPTGASFSPWVIVRASDGALYFAPGTWRDKSGNSVDAPAPLAEAITSAGPVVDAEGVIQMTGRTVKPETAASPPASPATAATPADESTPPPPLPSPPPSSSPP
jgi:hypothetical protein